MPDEKGRRQLRRLRDISGYKIDHPAGPGEGKDTVDARLMATWLAAVHFCSAIETCWLGE